jgi:hypothetical protein
MSWYNLCRSNNNEFRPDFYKSVSEIPVEDWTQIVGTQNIYLSLPYLASLEKSMKEQVDFRYIIFYSPSAKPVAIASVQILDFNNEAFKKHEAFCKVADKIKTRLLQSLDMKMMVCGNVFSCGENGFAYSSDVSAEAAFNNLSNGLYQLRQMEKGDKPVSVVLLKEFEPSSYRNSDVLKSAGFKDFKVDVNMVLQINSDWRSMEDYLHSMTTKFRTKAKGVFKKSKDLIVKDLSANEIESYTNEIAQLYQSVVERAEFKFGILNVSAFVEMKKNLENNFLFKAYFLDKEMVGFSSAYISDESFDANYVGLNYQLNVEYAIYQRMLYDFVQESIARQVKELHLGRTAEEIKSCLGAEPMDMKLYLRHRNSISNKLLAPIIATITPSEFELRYPFKADYKISA